jgi:hypothetical protein
MQIQLPQLFHSLEGREPRPFDRIFMQIQFFKLLKEPEPAEPVVADARVRQPQCSNLRRSLEIGKVIRGNRAVGQIEHFKFGEVGQMLQLRTSARKPTLRFEDAQVFARLDELFISRTRAAIQLAQLREFTDDA